MVSVEQQLAAKSGKEVDGKSKILAATVENRSNGETVSESILNSHKQTERKTPASSKAISFHTKWDDVKNILGPSGRPMVDTDVVNIHNIELHL